MNNFLTKEVVKFAKTQEVKATIRKIKRNDSAQMSGLRFLLSAATDYKIFITQSKVCLWRACIAVQYKLRILWRVKTDKPFAINKTKKEPCLSLKTRSKRLQWRRS